MYSIGEFSKITGLSIKAIHLYHEKRLLVPAQKSEESGYRYFDESNLERARAIAFLRAMEFSLAEIGAIMEGFEEEGEVVGFLERKRAAVETQVKRLKEVAVGLDTFIQGEREVTQLLKKGDFAVEEHDVDPCLVASLRWRGKYEQSGKAFMKLGRKVGIYIAGKPINLYYDAEFKEDQADIESCFPVRKRPKAEGITVQELAGGKCVSFVHQGPYPQLGRSYAKVFDYLGKRGLKPHLPSREIFRKGPGLILKGNPRQYLTEIQLMVEG